MSQISLSLETTICLNMIVKNESSIITRLLDSVKSIIDYVCVCDTGSTDNTIEIIETWMKANNKPGIVVKEPFKNFGYNRTFGIRAAQKYIKDNSQTPDLVYLLFLDADMKLVIGPSFSKDMLKESNYSIAQKAPELTYYNLRLVKASTSIECVGVTHEYYNVQGTNYKLPEEILHIADIGDGGSKGDKAPRDIRLLTAGLEDPETPDGLRGRYYFYLANTYFDIGNIELAIKTYNDRITAGGWYEEIWYSKYRIGLCMFRLNRVNEGICSMLEAYEFHPKRAEPLYEIVKAYRIKGKQNIAYMIYKEAKSIPYPKDDVLFINHNIYKYELDYELSIIGYYVKHPNIDKLTVKLLNEMPYVNFGHMMANYKFYTKNIIKDSIDFTDHSIFPNFFSSTPCIVQIKDRDKVSDIGMRSLSVCDTYLMLVRHVNHRVENGVFINQDKITSCYRILRLDSEFHKVEEYSLDFPYSGDRHYQGIEDVKFYKSNRHAYKFVGTMQSINGPLCIGYGTYKPKSTSYFKYAEVKSPNNRGCEKNWCFYEGKDEEIRVLYEWDNLQTYKFEDGTLSDLTTMKTPPIFKHFRGSTHGVSYQNMVWFLAHLVHFENNKRYYYHVIIIVDFNKDIIRYTVPFKLEGVDIEFALGMVVREKDVVVSYSTNENTSKLGFISKFEIANMLV